MMCKPFFKFGLYYNVSSFAGFYRRDVGDVVPYKSNPMNPLNSMFIYIELTLF